jgi:23S rRNA pseudouridine955/2504/2580 synthase
VVQRIIGAKGAAPSGAVPPTTLGAVAPSVHYVRIDEGSAGQRLDNFLIKLLKGVPKSHVHRVIRSGEVRVNQGRAAADTRLMLDDKIRVPPVRVAATGDPQAVPARDFAVLFEDRHLIAIDKPAGVAVHGGSGVSYGVIEQMRRARPNERFLELVHRLDKETSGVLLVARQRASLIALQDQLRLRDKNVAKTYLALVLGTWPERLKVIDVALLKTLNAEGERRVRVVDADHADARRSITLVKVQRRFKGFTLLEVSIKTGRTHQIRVHLANAGHAIVGDSKYGNFELNKALARGTGWPGVAGADGAARFEGMFLHAWKLRIAHPASGEPLELASPVPAECGAFLETLETVSP